MNDSLKKKLELLKLKEEILKRGALGKEEKSSSNSNGPSKEGKSLTLTNGSIKGFEAQQNFYQQNGYVNAFLLGFLSFFFEVLFLVISYFMF